MAPLDDVSAHPVRDDGLDGQPVLNPLNGVDTSGASVHKSASEDAFAQEAAIFPELPLVEVRYDFSVKVTVPRVRRCGASEARNSERSTCCTRRRCMLAAHAGYCGDTRAASTRRRPRGGDSARNAVVVGTDVGRATGSPVAPQWAPPRHRTLRVLQHATLSPAASLSSGFLDQLFRHARLAHRLCCIAPRRAPRDSHTRRRLRLKLEELTPFPQSAEADEHPSVVHSLLGPAYTAYKLLKLRIAAKSGDHVPVPPPFSVVSILTDCHGTLPVGSLSLILGALGTHAVSTSDGMVVLRARSDARDRSARLRSLARPRQVHAAARVRGPGAALAGGGPHHVGRADEGRARVAGERPSQLSLQPLFSS